MRLRKGVALLALAAAACVSRPAYVQPPPPLGPELSIYDALSPYGDWIAVEHVGHCWRPAVGIVGPGFVPYQTSGRWVYTDYGWVFASNFAWGWGPFHYGRWFFSDVWGWLWAPDVVWGPAWVEWRHGPGFVGWAPLPPARLVTVINTYRPPWAFVRSRHFTDPDPHRYRLGPEETLVAFRQTEVVSPRQLAGHAVPVGPPRARIASEARVEIGRARIEPPRPLSPSALRVPPRLEQQRPVAPWSRPEGPARVTGGTPLPLDRPVLQPRPIERAPAPPRPIEPGERPPSLEPAPATPRPERPSEPPQRDRPRSLEPAPATPRPAQPAEPPGRDRPRSVEPAPSAPRPIEPGDRVEPAVPERQRPRAPAEPPPPPTRPREEPARPPAPPSTVAPPPPITRPAQPVSPPPAAPRQSPRPERPATPPAAAPRERPRPQQPAPPPPPNRPRPPVAPGAPADLNPAGLGRPDGGSPR